ncbi:MAG: hypothetical protein RBR71_13595 [Gudongella sp.]|nr:hypothetical protein [Gudongella sp.]
MDLSQLPSWVTSFKLRKNNAHIMDLCLTYHVSLGLSLRKTAEAIREIHNINISHTIVASYARTAAVLIKPFVDTFDYDPSNSLSADETYIKIKGVKAYIWLSPKYLPSDFASSIPSHCLCLILFLSSSTI